MAPVIYGERFRHQGQPAWHGIGHPMTDENISAVDAFTEADMMYEVIKVPITVTLPNGTVMPASDKYAVVRMDTSTDGPAILATVGKEFEVTPNRL